MTPLTRDEAAVADFTDLTTAASRLPDESLLPGPRGWVAGASGSGEVWDHNPLHVSEPDPELTELTFGSTGNT